MGKVKLADLEPDNSLPGSIKELVIGALTDDDIRRGESIDHLMERIYEILWCSKKKKKINFSISLPSYAEATLPDLNHARRLSLILAIK